MGAIEVSKASDCMNVSETNEMKARIAELERRIVLLETRLERVSTISHVERQGNNPTITLPKKSQAA
jgi:transcription elongation GreA/GreB family factor